MSRPSGSTPRIRHVTTTSARHWRVRGRLDEAILHLTRATEIDPRHVFTLHVLGRTLMDRGRPDEAIVPLKRAIAIDPGHLNSQHELGRVLLSLGRATRRSSASGATIEIDPRSVVSRYGLGVALESRSRLDEAIEQYEQVLRIDPVYVLAHHNLGKALKVRGRLDEAIVHMRRAIELDPKNVRAHGEFAAVLRATGRMKEAVEQLERLLRIDPDSAMAHNEIAWLVALSSGLSPHDYEEAVRHARKAVEWKPDDANAMNTLALAEYRAGHWAESIAAALGADALVKGGHPMNWFILALAHWRNGEKDEARRWFDKGVVGTRARAPKDADLSQMWAEAATLLSLPGPDAPGPASTSAPVARGGAAR